MNIAQRRIDLNNARNKEGNSVTKRYLRLKKIVLNQTIFSNISFYSFIDLFFLCVYILMMFGSFVELIYRLQSELMSLMLSCPSDISAFPEAENMFRWVATITGAPGTVCNKFTFPSSHTPFIILLLL
jgi:hypothetical protein